MPRTLVDAPDALKSCSYLNNTTTGSSGTRDFCATAGTMFRPTQVPLAPVVAGLVDVAAPMMSVQLVTAACSVRFAGGTAVVSAPVAGLLRLPIFHACGARIVSEGTGTS